MLLIVWILFVTIESILCSMENKNEQELFDEINRERNRIGASRLDNHLTLELAAQKRCADSEQLLDTYKRMISNVYRDDDWPREEQLDKIFAHGKLLLQYYQATTESFLSISSIQNSLHFAKHITRVFFVDVVAETIHLNGLGLFDDRSLVIPNMYRTIFAFIGIAQRHHKNFSATCILYGSSNSSDAYHRRLIRLLYILIGCGILLLGLIICSVMNDRRRAKLKQQQEEQEMIEAMHNVAPMKSMSISVDKDRISPPRRTEINRATLARLGSTVGERSSAVHNFFQSPK